jgi:hypothetical protein
MLAKDLQGARVAQSVHRLSDGLEGRVRFQAEAEIFSVCHCVHTESGVHPAPYKVGTTGSLPEGKAAGEWSWLLTA